MQEMRTSQPSLHALGPYACMWWTPGWQIHDDVLGCVWLGLKGPTTMHLLANSLKGLYTIFYLTWECLRIAQEELGNFTKERDI